MASDETREEGHLDDWDLKGYLKSLGLNRNEAETWVKAREMGESFQSDWSDGMSHHLDRIWGRSLQSLTQLDTRSRATGQIPPIGELKKEHLTSRLATWRSIAAILWGYCIAIWLYVIAFQIANPDSPYWSVAQWLPIRMDYFGEAGFFASFIFAVIWAKLR